MRKSCAIVRAAADAAAVARRAYRRHHRLHSLENLEARRLLSGGPDGGELDFGDAPDSYRTSLAANGARHFATPNLLLGAAVDAEPDGTPDALALRDDLNMPIDDEDGIKFLDPIVPGTNVRVEITNGGADGHLNAWLDFNINGVFDAADQIFTDLLLITNTTTVHIFPVPAGAVAGDSYARFRLNFAGGIPSFGLGDFGEVEDYRVRIDEGQPGGELDFGDAPNTYRTTLAVNGARHPVSPNIFLGNTFDVEPDGQPSVGATRDDTTGIDDEDGIVFLTPIVPGGVASVQVTTGAGGGRLNAWMDFNINGIFDAGDQIFTNVPVPGASVTVLNFVVPATATVGTSYARFRLDTTGGLAPFGLGNFGEVEDYEVKIEGTTANLDFGDAPDTYRTTLAFNGARHTATPNLHLGVHVDTEPDGQPSISAQRDDANGIPDDEDGITFLDPIIPGTNVRVQVVNGAGGGRMNAWLDFNIDGSFGPGEQIFTNVGLPPASVTIHVFPVPAAAVNGLSYARFRLNPGGGLAPFGFGGFGEVEDYAVKIEQNRLDFGDAPEVAGGPFQYPTTLGGPSGNPARHVINPNGPRLGTIIDLEPDGQPTINADGDDLNGLPDDEDGVTVGGAPFESHVLQPGGVSAIEIFNPGPNGMLNAWFDWNMDGDWNDPGEHVAVNTPIGGAGTTIVNVAVPNTVPNAVNIYSRFRINSTGGLLPTGLANDGEVEDYINRTAPPPANLDFGDAPQTATGGFNYPTLLAANGARHVIVPAGPRLGNLIDPEPDGQQTVLANGDDLNTVDDEDGVRVGGVPFENVPLVPGSVIALQIFNPGPAGRLNAWFDWGQDGSWGAGEQPLVNVPAPTGVSIHNVLVPAGLPANSVVYSRFRINFNGGLAPTGLAPDGEVEDYRNRVLVDTTPPRATSAVLEFETFQGVTVTFTEPIDPATVSPGDLSALNLDDGTTPAANSVFLSAGNTVATWVFNTPGTFINDGDYQFTLAPGAVADDAGNGLAGGLSLSGPSIFFLAGDADRNRTVNLNDFNILAGMFGASGKTFSQGNFDYDPLGNVNLTDFNLLASRFGTSVAPGTSNSGGGAQSPFGDTKIGDEEDAGSLSDLIA